MDLDSTFGAATATTTWPAAGPATTLVPAPTADESVAVGSSGEGRGLIAAVGPRGLRLFDPAGVKVAEWAYDRIVTQPTWSRDGRRLAATSINPITEEARVVVIDVTTGAVATADARRPYFFYTWSYDGSRLAALGPGSSGTTAVDFLDNVGEPSSDLRLESGSIYVAWEPGGSRVLLHAGPRLVLVNDPDSPDDHVDLGQVGMDFRVPAWVPGTSDFLYVDSLGQGPENPPAASTTDGTTEANPRLLRRNADTGAISELGPVSGFTLIAVHPDGDRAALSSLSIRSPVSASEGSDAGALSAGAQQPAQDQGGGAEVVGSVQIIDFTTSERRIALEQPGFWLEWSPDGRRLLIATTPPESSSDPRLIWHTWDGQSSHLLARFTPTEVFAQNYLRFADQYTETPRLWSPDSTAITFGALDSGLGVASIAHLERAGQTTSLSVADASFWSPAPVRLLSAPNQ